MKKFETYHLQHNNILSVYADRDLIDLSPVYQRQGDIWSLEKKQLLIDSIINRYDIPKLYFNKLNKKIRLNTHKDYAVVDGRQRLESIFQFIAGEFSLSNDFEYLEDETIDASGMKYGDLAVKFPRLQQRIDAFSLPIICIDTDDLDLIEELFSRLNEAVPLNSAEKRNAIGGDMAKAIATLATNNFFIKKVKFKDSRYRYREVSARLMFLEYNLQRDKVIDTKKPLLDLFVKEFKVGKKQQVLMLKNTVEAHLKILEDIFNNNDLLLSAQSAIPIYYLLVRDAHSRGKLDKVSRKSLNQFTQARQENRIKASTDLAKADYELLEYDRMSLQGTNDASSIRERLRILSSYLSV